MDDRLRVAVVGGRDFKDEQQLKNVLDELNPRPTQIISGGAKGADTLAKKYADSNNIICTVVPARWELYGRAAGPIRNKEIVRLSDMVVAFWDGKSRGTKNTINTAKQYRKTLAVHNY